MMTSPAAVDALSKEDRTKAEATAMQAKIEFKSGAYDKAARLFLEAFAISRAPALMYNAARAYQKADLPVRASVVFEQYLELPGLSDKGRAEANKHLQSLRKIIAERKAKPTPPGEPAQSPVAQQADPARAKQPTASDRAVVTPAVPTAAPTRNKWVTYGLVGGGSLLTLIGLAQMSEGSKQAGEAKEPGQFASAGAKDIYNTRKALAEETHTGGVGMVTIGLGLAGWGVYRMYTPDPGSSAATWQARPKLHARRGGSLGLGWVVQGRF